MSNTVYKVKYIGGSGIELPYPLADGRSTIPGHTVITLTHYQDFVRLTESPLFVEVKDDAAKVRQAAPIEDKAVEQKPKTTTTKAGE